MLGRSKLKSSVSVFGVSAALVIAGLGALPLLGQDQPETPAAKGESTLELKQATRLQSASTKMRDHLKSMRLLAVKYHLSEDAQTTKTLQAEWRSMLVTGHKIHQAMVEAAVADFKAEPKLESEAGIFLTQLVGRNADADRFDGMLEIVQLLHEHGMTGKNFSLCYALTAGATNNFALARPHLEEAAKNLEESMRQLAVEKGISDEERQQIGKKISETYDLVMDLSQTEAYEKLWQDELKVRQADAAGEPLPRVLFETTKGDIEIELFENQAPNTVANFVKLCEEGFFDKLPFHRVITHFMAQGGDPLRDGSGGPGYSIKTELNGQTDRMFFRGTLGMALSSVPDSGGSQFFICYVPRSNLNGKYVAFGRVINGMNIVGDLARVNPEDKNAEKTQELPDEILSTKVLFKRNHPYKPEIISSR